MHTNASLRHSWDNMNMHIGFYSQCKTLLQPFHLAPTAPKYPLSIIPIQNKKQGAYVSSDEASSQNQHRNPLPSSCPYGERRSNESHPMFRVTGIYFPRNNLLFQTTVYIHSQNIIET